MLEDLEAVIGPDETILYEGKPDPRCFLFENIFNPMLPFAIVWALFDMTFLGAALSAEGPEQTSILVILIPFLLIHMMPVWIYLGGVVTSSMKHKNTSYIVTDKAVYVSGGSYAKTIDSQPYTEMTSVNLHRGFFDQRYNVGDIIITTNARNNNGKRLNLNISSISEYLEVYNLVKDLYQKSYDNY